MPELPEVETVRAGLAASIEGSTIKKVILMRANLRIPFPQGFVQALAGKRIAAITRRAKYLLFALDSGDVVIAHLGMSGRFLVHATLPNVLQAHDHVVWQLGDGRVVIYNDPRRFGLMTLARVNALSEHALFSALGPEPLEKQFSAAYLHNALAMRRAPVKPVLMDQAVVVGVGNIYASEALFLAGVDPRQEAYAVADKAGVMVKSIQKVLRDAIASGGSSLRDFLKVSGEAGYFQHHFNVYDRKGEPCFQCKMPVISIRQAGRSTYLCQRCQS